MVDHTPDDAQQPNWRDLAGQLTPEQIAELEYCERGRVLPPEMATPQSHYRHAAAMVALNQATARFANIAPPAGYEVDDWMDLDGGIYQRMCTAWVHPTVKDVAIHGFQYSDDGRTEWHVFATAPDTMTAEQTRQFADALTAAAAELERLERDASA